MNLRVLVFSLLFAVHAPSRAQGPIEYRHLREGSLRYIVFPEEPASRPWLRFNSPDPSPGEIKSLTAFLTKSGRLDFEFKVRGRPVRLRLRTRARDIVARDGHLYLIYRSRRGTLSAREITDMQLSFVDPRGLLSVSLAAGTIATFGAWTTQPILAGTAAGLAVLTASLRFNHGVNLLSCRKSLMAEVPEAAPNRPLF